MVSSRRRSLRKLGNYVNRLDRRVRDMSKRQSVTKLADRTVTTPKLEEGAVTIEILDSTIVTDITDAGTTADTALSTANGKNKVYRQASAPTGGTYAEGDLWFDTDDDNKIYRYVSGSWSGFSLGDNALASLSANKITAGTIDAAVITVSNLDAGNITVGTLTGIAINIGTGATSFHADSTGNMWLGADDYASAPFRVSKEGDISALSGQIASIDIILKNDLILAYQDFATVAALANAGVWTVGDDNTGAEVSGVLIGDTGRSIFTEVNTPHVGAFQNSYIEFGNLAKVRHPNATNPVGTLSLKNIRYSAGAPPSPQVGDIWLS